MNKIIKTLLCLLMFFIGCDNSNDDDASSNTNSVEVITHDIDAAGAPGFYYDLHAGAEVDSSNTWHLSFQMIPVPFGQTTYMMPSLVLGETAYVAVYNDIVFDEVEGTPDTFMSDYFQDRSVVQYSGAHEILQYDMQVHRVSVKEPERVFIAYELDNHTTYAIQFMEYVSGVIAFKFKKF